MAAWVSACLGALGVYRSLCPHAEECGRSWYTFELNTIMLPLGLSQTFARTIQLWPKRTWPGVKCAPLTTISSCGKTTLSHTRFTIASPTIGIELPVTPWTTKFTGVMFGNSPKLCNVCKLIKETIDPVSRKYRACFPFRTSSKSCGPNSSFGTFPINPLKTCTAKSEHRATTGSLIGRVYPVFPLYPPSPVGPKLNKVPAGGEYLRCFKACIVSSARCGYFQHLSNVCPAMYASAL